MAIGEVLREAREARGLSLEAVEDATKIQRKYIKALESEEFSVLPGRVYAKAFLRTYAKYLGLDSESLVAEFNQRFPGDERQDTDEEPAGSEPAGRRSPAYTKYLVVLLVIAALVGFNALYRFGSVDRGEPNLPGSPPAADEQRPPEDVAPVEPPVREGLDLVLRVDGSPSWMRVIVDGQVSFEGTVQPGKSLTFTGKDSISLRVGNAGAVRATLNGEDLGVLGEPWDVVTRDFPGA
ncbi:MAG: DUF4115 domain-containing protein [Thermoanaerobacterales bacterium]|nr:DUF4115 domain-containing protein [Bacillota bacterium]MDI6906606.1 DUF4115 domain-containing protein [Thermoanaerobacterales bacterium]